MKSITYKKKLMFHTPIGENGGNTIQCEGSNYKDLYGEVIKKLSIEYLQSMQSQVVDQVLQANPELQKLLQANPGVKSASNSNPATTESNENISMGAHSDNQLVHIEASGGKEVGSDIEHT